MTETLGASLTRRVPAFIAVLLAVVLGTATVVGYAQLRRILIQQNEDRLSVSTDLLGRLLSSQLDSNLAQLRVDADSLATVVLDDGSFTPGASSALAGAARARSQGRGLWVEGPGGSCLGLVHQGEIETVTSCPDPDRVTPDPGPSGVGGLFAADGEARYGARITLERPGGPVHVTFEQAFTDKQSATLISSLVAPDAELLLGNAAGDVWTDLGAPVERDVVPDNGGGAVRFMLDGEARIGAAAPIAGTPWVALIHRSESLVLEPSRAFLWWMGGAAIGILALGTLLASALSRRITKPLAKVSRGAEAIAKGDYHQHVDVVRDDEIGRLARAFNTMATRVETDRATLEKRVEERTESLRDAQEELIRKERLATIGQLAGGVGHELRNPLGVMTNALFYLQAVIERPPEKVREYLEILSEQIQASEKIVTDLLDFARVKGADREDVSARKLFESALAHATPPDSVTVDVDLPEPAPSVHADPRQVVQILQNLTSNAIQAMGNEGGTLTCSVSRANGRVVLSVDDTGPGIAPDQLERIFEPLVTSRARGIGLGLAVSRTLAAQNGGSLEVRSEVGVGSTFDLSLPGGAGEEAP